MPWGPWLARIDSKQCWHSNVQRCQCQNGDTDDGNKHLAKIPERQNPVNGEDHVSRWCQALRSEQEIARDQQRFGILFLVPHVYWMLSLDHSCCQVFWTVCASCVCNRVLMWFSPGTFLLSVLDSSTLFPLLSLLFSLSLSSINLDFNLHVSLAVSNDLDGIIILISKE